MTEVEKARVLFVDDEPDLLNSVVRGLRSPQYDIACASSGKLALSKLASAGPFAVIVTDLNMPGMDGIELLKLAREVSPETVRILFTGQAGVEHAVAAVNDGAVFRFLTKPCSRINLALTVKAALDHHRLVSSERVLLEQTVHGAVKALTEVLGLASPMAFGRATRLRHTVTGVLSAMNVKQIWHIEMAAMLSQIGSVVLPPDILERVHRGEDLSGSDREILAAAPRVAEQIVANIPRLEPVLEVIRLFGRPPEDAPEDASESALLGAKVLRAAEDFDQLENEGLTPSLALDTMRGREGRYDPAVLEAFAQARQLRSQDDVRELATTNLRPGMILARDLRTKSGMLFVARGQEVTESMVEKVRNFMVTLQIEETVRVVIRQNAPPAPPPS